VLEHLVREMNRTYEELARIFADTAKDAKESAMITPRHLARLAVTVRIARAQGGAIARGKRRTAGRRDRQVRGHHRSDETQQRPLT
jgi:hypothetical protein